MSYGVMAQLRCDAPACSELFVGPLTSGIWANAESSAREAAERHGWKTVWVRDDREDMNFIEDRCPAHARLLNQTNDKGDGQ